MTTEEVRDAPISNVETEYLEINNSKGAWVIPYQHIRNECTQHVYTCNESKKPQNRNLNRYRDVAPYDHTRIILKRGSCDYINANLIQMEKAHRKYILTQGPLPYTTSHFWVMVWEQNSKAIVMLNKTIEKNQVKCHQYWPLSLNDGSSNEGMTFSDVGLKVEFLKRTETDYTTSVLRLTDIESDESREILHFHYTTWPDFGVPRSPMAFLRFLADVRESGVLDQNVGPAIVHCSAGIGRSGTFCLVDTCLILIEENGLNSVNVRDVLIEMRKSRMGLIQTPDQLRFSYAAIIEGAKQLPSNNVNFNNEIISNHYDLVSSLTDTLNQEDDEPPPPPPPRGESLSRNVITTNPKSENVEPYEPPDKPLPTEPVNKTETRPMTNNCTMNHSERKNSDDTSISNESLSENEESPLISPSNSNMKNELRQRNREKQDKLSAQVREIKRRQKETEDWQNFKRSKNESTESEDPTLQKEAESTM